MDKNNVSWFVWFETKLNEFSMMTKSIFTLIVIAFLVQCLTVLIFANLFSDFNFDVVYQVYRIYFSQFPGILFGDSELYSKIKDVLEQVNLEFFNQLIFMFAATSPIYILFLWRGFAIFQDKSKAFGEQKYLRGSKLISEAEQIKIASKQKSDFQIAKIPLPVDAETYHSLIIGSSGAGKTQLLKKVVLKAKNLNRKALIHDIKGDWISEFYNKEKDFILNPMDARSVRWTIWNDIKNVTDIKNFCSWIIPEGGKDPFWNNSARMILESILLFCYDRDLTTNDAIKQLLFLDGETLAEKLRGYGRGAEFAAKKDSFLNLQAQMSFIDFLPDGDFSLKEWVKNGNGFLFLSNTEETQALMKPVLSLAVQVISSTLLNLSDDRERRFYLFLDEFTSLQKLEKVLDLLKLGRSKGVSVWLAFQDFQQLEKIYSREDRATVINNTGTIAVLRLKEADAALYFSKRFAKQEFLEKSKTISMGVAANRDGLSFNEQRKEDYIVKDSEILNLQPLECFVMISFLDGVAKSTIDIIKMEVINSPLELIKLTKKEEIQLLKASQLQSLKKEKEDIRDKEESTEFEQNEFIDYDLENQ